MTVAPPRGGRIFVWMGAAYGALLRLGVRVGRALLNRFVDRWDRGFGPSRW